MAARLIAALRAGVAAALAHWREQPVEPIKHRCCSFDGLGAPAVRSAEDVEAAAWYRAHFRVNGRPLP